jgi:hypothetical protein
MAPSRSGGSLVSIKLQVRKFTFMAGSWPGLIGKGKAASTKKNRKKYVWYPSVVPLWNKRPLGTTKVLLHEQVWKTVLSSWIQPTCLQRLCFLHHDGSKSLCECKPLLQARGPLAGTLAWEFPPSSQPGLKCFLPSLLLDLLSSHVSALHHSLRTVSLLSAPSHLSFTGVSE